MSHGYIYKITSPSGKCYIGQVVEFLSDGSKKGIDGRWKQHINASKRMDNKGCRRLNNEMNKYGYENFQITTLMKCRVEVLNLFEEFYIKTHNTLVPYGLNLQSGGKKSIVVSEETKKRMSDKMKLLLQDPSYKKIWSDAKKNKVQVNKRKCKLDFNQHLPKYIYFRENGKYKGYTVDHPLCCKRFSKSSYTLEKNLQLAMHYVEYLDTWLSFLRIELSC
jgi:group I intron endonuclease